MGCICSKGAKPTEDAAEVQRDKEPSKSSKLLFTSSRREDIAAVVDADSISGNDVRLVTKSQENVVVPVPLASVDRSRIVGGHQRRATVDVGVHGPGSKFIGAGDEDEPHLGIVDVPNSFKGEHVAAGWPSWLTCVAAEAVRGWLPRKAESFEKLDKIGQGTYSNVYKARDLETGKIVALKKVRFVNMDPESVRFMAREIHILRRLDHPNVLKLEGLVTSRMSCSLYLVFEYMEHDLAGLAATPGIKFSEPQVKCYMKQLLCGLDHCHDRGVLHRDIKGSNLLIDDNGVLRIGDFGLATIFNPDQQQQLTSRVVTLWYRPPELLLGATEYSVGVDLWSTGCILAELLAGKPIMPGRTEVEQMHKIFKLCGSPSEDFWMHSKLPHATIFKPQHPYQRCLRETYRDFPSSALDLLDTLLAIEPADRGTAASALNSSFFKSPPLACDPSSLPKYPPSKELDAKLRDEEARRQRAALKAHAGSVRGSRDPDDYPVANTLAESKEQHTREDVAAGYITDNSYGRSVHPGGAASVARNHKAVPGRSSTTLGRSSGPQLKTQGSYKPQERGADFANFAGLGAGRGTVKSDNFREPTKHQHWPEHRPSNRYNQLDVADASNHVLDRPSSTHKKDLGVKDTTIGYGTKKSRIHYSGPLMPPGGNIDDMLKEHERQIQHAVRKARLDKDKTKKHFG